MRIHHALIVLALAGLTACESDNDADRGRTDRGAATTGDSRTTTRDTRNDDGDRTNTGDRGARVGYPATRALSILHAKNTEEIELGRLAEQNASSNEVREYGRMLVRHHQDNDSKVQNLARELNVSLTNPTETQQMLLAERNPGQARLPDQSPRARLANLRGAEFDRAFADEMVRGHRDAIDTMIRERDRVQNNRVRSLIDETLPVLRDHLARAEQLPRG